VLGDEDFFNGINTLSNWSELFTPDKNYPRQGGILGEKMLDETGAIF
jgi:hypothetical protein